jgi:hypothetical protein
VTGRTGGSGRTGRTGRIGRTGTAARIAALIVFVSFVSFVSSVPFVSAQTVTQRGFVEGSTLLFPQAAPNDRTQAVTDFLAREELFVKPAPWMQFAGGLELRANSHDQVEDRWRLDVSDRGVRRPRLSLRRLTATLTHGPFTLDAGKQFIRWGKADIINPTDRFAPRDFLNVVDTEFLAVTGLRGVAQHGADTFEAVWVPRFTPSRVPLLDQRWTAVPAEAASVPLVDAGAALPSGAETGLRWGHVGDGLEYSLSFFNGFNHLPNIAASTTLNAEIAEKICSACSASSAFVEIRREHPAIRTYGADAVLPTKWFTIKGEAAYFTSSTPLTDEYVLYVVQLERQTGEWVIVAGYAGEATTLRRSTLLFAPDRGMTRAIVARASYTIDPVRSLAVETAVRQNGAGVYGKFEYSQARGQHWRATVTGVGIGGHSDDFLGQYHRNSHLSAALRYSF